MNKIKNIVRNIALLLMLFVSISIVAQVNKTTGTRITDNMVEKSLDNTAILDLDSSTKGFYMPRMNTAQRDQLATRLLEEKGKGNENTGLVIYNTSNDCIEYWHASTEKWRSLCGSLPPAKLDLMDGCGNVELSANIKVDGVAAPSWQQGMALKPEEHTMTIRVYVSQIGTYQISADSGNGYFFSAEGQFQSEGNYTVVLKGMGAPKQGYDQADTNTGQKADRLKFSFNGQPSAKCPDGVAVKIIPAFLKFQINREEYQAKGDYFVGKEASDLEGNKIEIKVNVDVIGTARVVAKNDALGLAFVGEKIFTIDGPNQSMTLTPMSGKLAPKLNELESYELKFEPVVKPEDVANTINGATAIVKVRRSEISLDPKDVQFGKEPFYQGTALNTKNVITVPVKVIGSGKVDLVLTNAEGVKFEAKGVVLNKLENENEKQNIPFTPVIDDTKKMPDTTTSEFTLSGTGGRFFIADDSKKITFNLDKKPVSYTFACSDISSTKNTITVDQEIRKTYALKIRVDVKVPGEYELRTDTDVEGIYFTSNVNGVKQVFPHDGFNDVYLYAEDQRIAPKVKTTYNVRIINRDGNKDAICTNTFPIKVGNADLNVLYLVPSAGDVRGYEFDKWIKGGGEERFGDRGKFAETGKVNVTKTELGPYAPGHSSNINNNYFEPVNVAARKKVAEDIMAGKYNFIYMDGHELLAQALDKNIQLAIENFVYEQKGGLLIFTATGNHRDESDFFEAVSKTTYAGKKKNKDDTLDMDSTEHGALLNWFKTSLNKNKNMPSKETRPVRGTLHGVLVDLPWFGLVTQYPLVNNKSIVPGSGYIGGIDVTGSEWDVLVKPEANSPANLGAVIVHKKYNISISAMTDSSSGRAIWYTSNVVGPNADAINDSGVNFNSGTEHQTHSFYADLFATQVRRLMNQ